LFYKDLGTGKDLVLTVVVDDMIVGGPSFETLQAFEQKFATIFTLSLCEDIRLWLGIAVIYDRLNRSIFLSQSDYICKQYFETVWYGRLQANTHPNVKQHQPSFGSG
jgi:hypothetical protein